MIVWSQDQSHIKIFGSWAWMRSFSSAHYINIDSLHWTSCTQPGVSCNRLASRASQYHHGPQRVAIVFSPYLPLSQRVDLIGTGAARQLSPTRQHHCCRYPRPPHLCRRGCGEGASQRRRRRRLCDAKNVYDPPIDHDPDRGGQYAQRVQGRTGPEEA
jgi:hypothetical protein